MAVNLRSDFYLDFKETIDERVEFVSEFFSSRCSEELSDRRSCSPVDWSRRVPGS